MFSENHLNRKQVNVYKFIFNKNDYMLNKNKKKSHYSFKVLQTKIFVVYKWLAPNTTIYTESYKNYKLKNIYYKSATLFLRNMLF